MMVIVEKDTTRGKEGFAIQREVTRADRYIYTGRGRERVCLKNYLKITPREIMESPASLSIRKSTVVAIFFYVRFLLEFYSIL